MIDSPHFTRLIDQLALGAHLASEALSIACDKNARGTEDEKRAEWLPLFFVPRGAQGELTPTYHYESEDPLAILERNLKDTTHGTVCSPLLAGLYSDFLWRQRSIHGLRPAIQFADLAIDKYLLAGRERLGDGELFWDALIVVQQIARLGTELNRGTTAGTAARLLGDLVVAQQDCRTVSAGITERRAIGRSPSDVGPASKVHAR
jgi:hypothetical protein